MPTLSALKTRIESVQVQNEVEQAVKNQLILQGYQARFSGEKVKAWCEQFQLSFVELALQCLPIAACYAFTPVSRFYVGAVAIGQSGSFYFGANQEFAEVAISQTVHAEQSAITHGWLAGEKAITDMVVNYTPCGHCRQFMNELNTAHTLKIHLPHRQNSHLCHYLPDAFGPKDLNINKVLFDPQLQTFSKTSDDLLIQHAILAAQHAYAPYSHAISGVAMQVDSQIITGRYAENAAFNPSFLPLQSAINFARLSGIFNKPSRIVMAEKSGTVSHRYATQALAKVMFNLNLEYYAL